MQWSVAAILAKGVISFSGTLGAAGASGTVTGTQRSVRVPGNNTGKIKFTNLANVGSGGTAMNYKQNAGAFTQITNNLVVDHFLAEDLIQLQGTGLAAGGNGFQVDLVDNDSGTTIVSGVQILRS